MSLGLPALMFKDAYVLNEDSPFVLVRFDHIFGSAHFAVDEINLEEGMLTGLLEGAVKVMFADNGDWLLLTRDQVHYRSNAEMVDEAEEKLAEKQLADKRLERFFPKPPTPENPEEWR